MEYNPGVPRLSEAYAYSILKANDLEFDGTTLSRMKAFLGLEPMLARQLADEKIPYESIGEFGFNENNATEISIARAFNRVKGREAALLRQDAIYQAADIKVFDKNQITKEWLMEKLNAEPLVVGLDINLQQWEAAKNGEIRESSPRLPSNGGHAVLITNYTADGYLVFRNSWSIRWGDRGYGYMSIGYALNHILEAMEIGKVRAVPREPSESLEHFDVRANASPHYAKGRDGLGRPDGKYQVYLSLVLLSRWVPGGGIDRVTYDLYPANTVYGVTQPLGSVESTDADKGFYGYVLTSGREHSFQVFVKIHHRDGYTTNGWRTLPEVLMWSPSPILEQHQGSENR